MARVCIYHAGCPDGFGAAWAVRRAWGDDTRFVARGHDDALDARGYRGDEVVFVDIAPPNEALRALADEAAHVTVLDHHISSLERLNADPGLENAVEAQGHRIHFDLAHSGAVLAWQHFHPDEPVPDLLRYVEDQDLWNWALPRSDAVNAAIGSYPREFAVWDELASKGGAALADEGAPIVRAQRIDVERALAFSHPVAIGEARVEAVNARVQRAAIGHELALRAQFGQPWGLVYRVQGDRVNATLYSIGDLDVAREAVARGGGGHRNAAGFSVSLTRWLADYVAPGS